MARYAAISILTVLIFQAHTGSALAQSKTLNGTAPAAALQSVEVRGGVGSVIVSPGSGSEIHYTVRLTAKTEWHLLGRTTGRPDLLGMREDRRGSVLILDLSGDRRNIDEEWTVEVPEAFAAKIKVDVGKIRVSGIRGGCDTRMDVGDIDVRVPEGDVTAENDVGDIRVSTGTASYGNVDLHSDVGKVNIALDGHDLERKRAPGSGDSLRLNGSGRDHIRAHTDVGGVQVRIR